MKIELVLAKIFMELKNETSVAEGRIRRREGKGREALLLCNGLIVSNIFSLSCFIY